MISNASDHLLFVEPSQAPTSPVIDDLTRRVTAAWRNRVDGRSRTRGQHQCTGAGCRAMSGNGEHTIAGRWATNSLAIHYVACHRAEVPADQLAAILTLPSSDVEPTAGELAGDWRACDPTDGRRRRETRGEAQADPLRGYSPDEIIVGPEGQTLAQAASEEVEMTPGWEDRAVERAKRDGALPSG